MASLFEYMQFSLGVYAASDRNYIDPPAGWTRSDWQPDKSSGFSAGCYVNGTEMVISYTGTNDSADMANWSIGLGLPFRQVFDAVDYYFACKAAHPEATNITFSGHSLGGGLASLMAVYFNKPATVFDEAPFQLAALNPLVTDAVGVYMIANGYLDSEFSNYILSGGGAALFRESNVTHYYIDGEALNYPRFSFDTLVGNEYVFSMGDSTAGSINRHSMALMAAIQYSNEYPNAFHDVVKKLPDLVTELLDTNLFATDSRDPNKEDLLRRLLRHQIGVKDAIQPDGMLDRFASDMNMLAQDGGMTMRENQTYYNWNNISKALTAFAMQFYYEDTANAKDPNKQLFTDLNAAGEGSNGLRFDISDVSQAIKTKIDGGTVKFSDLVADIKGFGQYFQNYLDTTSLLSPAERTLIKSMLPIMRDWYVQAGASGMTATDTQNRGAFMLGGNGSDTLTGGAKADLLVGNAGDDTLNGGAGSDTLIGGTGVDTYVFQTTPNAGIDTILDSDHTGYLRDDTVAPIVLTGGAQYGDARVFQGKDANGTNHLYTFVTGNRSTGGDLLVDGAMLIKDWRPNAGNGMGLSLDAAAAVADPQPATTFVGDPLIHSATIAPGGVAPDWRIIRTYNQQYTAMDDGNGNMVDVLTAYDVDYYLVDTSTGNPVETGGPERADTLNGTTANDHLMGMGGNDTLYAADCRNGGDDILDGGAGRDWIYAGTGNDILIGGSEGDIMDGGAGDDRLYSDSKTTVEQAIANGNLSNSGTGLQGDWLAGGAGDDTLVGSSGNDVLMGGDGTDLLIGGAGDDDIAGDTDWVAFTPNWSVSDQIDGSRLFLGTNGNQPASGAADVIYAGNGNDHVWGEFGNDVIFGEGGADTLRGGEGNDLISGGRGDDKLYGGVGSDLYVYNLGDGKDELNDSSFNGETNILRFGTGITPDSVALSANAEGYRLTVGDGGYVQLKVLGGVRSFENMYIPILPESETGIRRFEFDDGTVLTWQNLLERGFDQHGDVPGADVQGTDLNDRLSGTGNATLRGGLGSDTYLYNLGDGAIHIVDASNATDTNTLRFGAGITANQIKLGLGSLKLDLGNGDEVHIDNFDHNDVFNSSSIQRFEFEDGTQLSHEDLLARGFDLDGSTGNDTILGTNTVDRMTGKDGNDILDAGSGNDILNGGAGNDTILGGDGNDWLEGGKGNDVLAGGAGSDIYKFSLGDGQDIVDNADYADAIQFGAGIAAGNVTMVSEAQDSLRLRYGTQGDSVLLVGSLPGELRFADGSRHKVDDLLVNQGKAPGIAVVGTAAAETLVRTPLGVASLQGGGGNDSMMGGGRDTTYYLNLGDGVDSIVDLGGRDTLSFGAGITVDDVHFSWDANSEYLPRFRVSYGTGGDAVTILNGESGAIEQFEFADGSRFSFGEMAARSGFVAPVDTSGSGPVVVQSVANRRIVAGTAAMETIQADNSWADEFVIAAGAGDDYIQISENDDTGIAYLLFNVGDGHDTINVLKNDVFNHQAVNTVLLFGAGISQDSLRFTESQRWVPAHRRGLSWVPDHWETDLRIDYGRYNDSLLAVNGLDDSTVFKFADGRQYSYSQMLAHANRILDGGVLTGSGEGNGYQYNAGDGSQVLGTDLSIGGHVSFGAGITQDQLSLGLGSLLIRVGENGDELHIQDFNPQDAYAYGPVEFFDFADGSTLTYSQLLDLGFDLKGSAGDDVITGTSATDRIDGLGGDDVIDGGAGNDDLVGGTGNDTYVFGYGDGVDRVYDSASIGSFDKVMFKPSVTPTDVSRVRNGDDLELHLVGSADMLILSNWFTGAGFRVEQVQFADGTVWGVQDFADLGLHAPEVAAPLQDQVASAGEVFSYELPRVEVVGDVLTDATDAGTPDQVWPSYDNYLRGSGGNDTYTFARGDGNVYISDWDNSPMDTLQFTDVLASDITVTKDQQGVMLSVNGTMDSLNLSYWISDDQARIEQVQFADGTVWGVNDIMVRVSALPSMDSDWVVGTDGNDTIFAMAGDDAVYAGAGDDTVLGGSGDDNLEGEGGGDILSGGSGVDEIVADSSYTDTANDILSGGSGDDYLDASISNDLLIGGAGEDDIYGDDGNDVLLFNRGDGNDWYNSDYSSNEVPVAQRTDTVSLGGGIAYSDLAFEHDSGSNLILHTGNGESVSFYDWFDTSWQDNKAIDKLQIIVEAMAGYDPASSDPLLNQRIQQFDFLGLANRFEADLAADPTITTWQLAPHLADFLLGGSDTAAIGGDMAYLYGKNGNLDGLSEAELRAQLSDAAFGTRSQTLTKTGTLTGSTVFSDVDAIHGDTLTYSATLIDGSALPAWLTFDPFTQTFSGTPGGTDGGVLTVSVIATDTAGLAASADFVLTVTGGQINVAPVANADYLVTNEDAGQAVIAVADLLANDTDADAGDTLSLAGFDVVTASGNAITQDAYGDLVFNLVNDYQSLAAGQSVTDSFSYTIVDAAGLTSAATVDVTITGSNDVPVVTTAVTPQLVDEDLAFSYTIPSGTFADIDQGDALNYSATLSDGMALPSWLAFDAATQTFSGVPDNWDVGVLNVSVTATDNHGASASSIFMLDVQNVNDTPTANADTGAAAEDGGSVLLEAATLLANDTDPDFIHGDTLGITGVSQAASGATVSLVNGAVQYDVGNLYQSLAQGQTITDTFSYTVTDTAGATSTAKVTMTITGINDGPVAADDQAMAQEDFGIAASGNVLANDTDIDQGTVLRIANVGTQQGLYGSLVLNADGSYNYVLDNNALAVQSLAQGQIVSEQFTYQASDGLASTPATLTVSITGTNDAPVVVADTSSVQEDLSITAMGNVLANDTDVDQGTVLTVASAGVFVGTFGTLTLNADGSYAYALDNASLGAQSLAQCHVVTDTFVYAATDGVTATTSELTVSITGTNDTPVVAVALSDTSTLEDQFFSFTVPADTFIDIDQGDVLTYQATLSDGTALPSWLSFDAATRTFNGTPSNWDVGVLNVSVTATDNYGASATSTFNLEVQNVNDAPIVVALMADQCVNHGKRFSITIPANTFDDWDIVHGDSLSYSATLADGEEFPDWLKFDAATGTFSGKAKGSDSYDILLTATDQAGASVSQIFTLTTGINKSHKKHDDRYDRYDHHDHHDTTVADTPQVEIVFSSSVNDIIHTSNGAGNSDQITLRDWFDSSANNKCVLTVDIITQAVI